jgi:hypothetical protein
MSVRRVDRLLLPAAEIAASSALERRNHGLCERSAEKFWSLFCGTAVATAFDWLVKA